MSSPINLRALDALRGLLAVYVLAGHARWLLWTGHREWLASAPAAWELPLGYSSAMLRYGHEAVMVFFVLSGFFIHLRAAEQFAGRRRGRARQHGSIILKTSSRENAGHLVSKRTGPLAL